MPVSIEFSTATAAFADFGEIEIVRVLRQITKERADGWESGQLVDINGNTIGQWSATIDEEGE